MKYGVLAVKHLANNLGDDVQGLAASRFLPSVDTFIDRDNPTEMAGGPDTFAFYNGWFTWRPDLYPPPANVKPIWIAVHIATPHLLTAATAEHLKAHEPIGARDLHTLSLLRAAGIQAYWSGCLTATLPKNDAPRTGGEVLLMDLNRKVAKLVPRSLRRGSKSLSNKVREPADPAARLELSKRLVDRLSKARLVITSRLHVAVPCAGVGTPCVMLHPRVNSDVRFGGPRGNLFRGYDRFTISSTNWDPEPLNVDPLRGFLETVCTAAVKYGDNPFRHESIELPEVVRRVGGSVGTSWTG